MVKTNPDASFWMKIWVQKQLSISLDMLSIDVFFLFFFSILYLCGFAADA